MFFHYFFTILLLSLLVVNIIYFCHFEMEVSIFMWVYRSVDHQKKISQCTDTPMYRPSPSILTDFPNPCYIVTDCPSPCIVYCMWLTTLALVLHKNRLQYPYQAMLTLVLYCWSALVLGTGKLELFRSCNWYYLWCQTLRHHGISVVNYYHLSVSLLQQVRSSVKYLIYELRVAKSKVSRREPLACWSKRFVSI
jgi:hypothetical protein